MTPGVSMRQGASHTPPAALTPAPPAHREPAPPRTSTERALAAEPPRRSAPASPFEAGPFTYAPRYKPWQRPRPPRYWGSEYYGSIPYGAVEPPADPRPSAGDDESLIGGLSLEVEPQNADVYVDGFYVGRLEDFAADGMPLRAGRHWIELRADGYQTLTIPVAITAGQLTRYRGGLAAERPPLVNPAPPPGSQTMYVIPGCYAGNRPPAESVLPKGCDIGALRTHRPLAGR